MPQLKAPRTLEDIALASLGKRVRQKAKEAIASGIHINITGLHDYIYADLPGVLWHKVTTHMLSEVIGSLTSDEDYGNVKLNNVVKSLILATMCHRITFLDLSKRPMYVQRILPCYIQTFKNLRILILSDDLPTDVVETLPIGLCFLTFLFKFRMQYKCTDAIIQTLGSCCSTIIEHIHVNYSRKVTDASFKVLTKCPKLHHLSICNTSVTAECFVQFLKSIRQHKKSEDKEKGLLHVGVGSDRGWDISTEQLHEIAITCPVLKELEIYKLCGNMMALVSLTTLEALGIHGCQFNELNLDRFLRLRGSNLLSIELHNVSSIDLTCIMNHCTNIKKLIVVQGSIMRNIEKTAETFQNLEILQLSCWFSPLSIQHMLYACVNVKGLFLNSYEEEISDEFVLRLLYNNPLRKLKVFRATSTELTMKYVDTIIEHCPLLEELQYINCFTITDAEIKWLRQKIKANNRDLSVLFHNKLTVF